MIERFRKAVYQSFTRRKDAGLDLIDALTSAEQVESPVAVSESPLFQRQFSSVYDALNEGRLDTEAAQRALADAHPPDAETIAGYEVYATDCTDHNHPEAETLRDRTQSKKGKQAPVQVGHRYSWVVRVVQRAPSWCLPQSVKRVGSETTDSQVAAKQIEELDGQSSHPKVVVADSLYCNQYFLAVFLALQTIFALVRMRSNQVLYEEPAERVTGQLGRSRKHGQKFKLSAPGVTRSAAKRSNFWDKKCV
ncbi:MAG: transposase, partial [Acidobacteriota bacterium]